MAASPYEGSRALAGQTPTATALIPIADGKWALKAGRSRPAGCGRCWASQRPDGLWARSPTPYLRPSPPLSSAGPPCQLRQLCPKLPLPLGSILQLVVFVQESFIKLHQTVDGWRKIQKEKTQTLSPSEQKLAIRCEVVRSPMSPAAWLIQGSVQCSWEPVNPRAIPGFPEGVTRRGGRAATSHVAMYADRCGPHVQGMCGLRLYGPCVRLTCTLVLRHCIRAWAARVCGRPRGTFVLKECCLGA